MGFSKACHPDRSVSGVEGSFWTLVSLMDSSAEFTLSAVEWGRDDNDLLAKGVVPTGAVAEWRDRYGLRFCFGIPPRWSG